MEPKGSLLHLEVPITCLYHEHNTRYLYILGKHVLIYKPAHRFCMTTIFLYCKHILWQKLHIFKSIMWQTFKIYMKQLLCTIEIYVPVVMVLLTAENMRKKCGVVASSVMILM